VDSIEATVPLSLQLDLADHGSDQLQRLLQLARTHLGMEIAMISEFDGPRQVIRTVSGRAVGMAVTAGQVLPLRDSYCIRVLEGVIPAVIPQARRHPGTRALAATREFGIGSYIGVPLLGPDDQPAGMLCCLSTSANPALNAQSLGFLSLLAELVGEQLRGPVEAARVASAGEAARVRSMLDPDRLRMVFQSVVRLDGGQVVAYEALARFNDLAFAGPAEVFAAAGRAGIGPELELLAVRQALDRMAEVPAGAWLGVNLSAEALVLPAAQELLLARAGERIGVEVTEHTPVPDYEALIRATQRLRNAGIQIGVDDAGAGYASFRHILKLRPTVIKLDLEIVRDVDTDRVRQALTRSLVTFSGEIGAALVAEGIETPEQLAMLQRLGVGFGQGYLFDRPGPFPR
jgi:EAL domain-containing protein (putative c-di-GMP-specific phosphodiesterase class I)